jgi:hypothetical protein
VELKLIADTNVVAGLRKAWRDSQPDSLIDRHEEGGYIVRNPDGTFGTESWPKGQGNVISVPQRDANGRYEGKQVIGEYHTHPNPPIDDNGIPWVQEPSDEDINGVKSESYPGDSYVISSDKIYRIKPDGTWEDMGSRINLLEE